MADEPLFMNFDVPAECPKLPEGFGVGSPILIISSKNERRGPLPAVVTKAARIWITAELTDVRYRTEYRFRMDNQTDGVRSYYATRFCTPEQNAWRLARQAAKQYLLAQRMNVDLMSPWRNRELELARALWLYSQSGAAVKTP